jgi:polysaccharide export outer membrane protein
VTRSITVLALAAVLATQACGPKVDNSRVHLPPPVENTTVGAGDVFTLQIVGEKDLPQEFQIDSEGNVNLPFVHLVHVDDLEPQEIADLVRKRLMKDQILSNPSVIVRVQQYNSKHVTVLGQVQKPGSFPFTPGITLIQLVSQAGGLNAIGNADWVNLIRKNKDGTKSVIISLGSIMVGRSPDIPLQAGDQIFVHERVF